MPSRRSAFGWLLHKEWSELRVARAWWVLLVAMGPLVGVSFISAVRTYAEASGLNGTAAGVGEAFSPLIGIWAPTFSGCELAAAFLLPFVAIRLVSGDRQSGAIKLEVQHPISAFARVLAKAMMLMAGWMMASVPAMLAVALWIWYGGHLSLPELATVLGGHVLNAGLTVALSAAMASMTMHPSTAAILTLAVTVGTWVISFVAAIHGGLWERIAGYTPTAMVAGFQRGLVQLDVVAIALVLIAGGLSLAAVWVRLGVPVRRRVYESLAVGAATAAVVTLCTQINASWDTSENRASSFSLADERALRRIHSPLHLVVRLAPEDPRRMDLESRVLSRLRRVMTVDVDYLSATSIGLFEQTASHYGEISYDLGGRTDVNRLTTAEGVLETIYSLAGVAPEASGADPVFRGYPLAVPPRGAATVFYGLWPAAVIAGAFLVRRQLS